MSDWVSEAGLKALPILVRCAQVRETITYGEIGKAIGIHHRQVGRAAGHIRDQILAPRDLPLLNALIVNADTRIPGDSYLPSGQRPAPGEAGVQEFERFRDNVFEFQHWDDLLVEIGLSPQPRSSKDYEKEAREYMAVAARTRGAKPEGDDHLALKRYVSNNPGAVGIKGSSTPHTEYVFLSGDKVDVAFNCGSKGWILVEVKIGARGELIKGIFQAIKYRALAHAQFETDASSILVAYTVPDDIAAYAAKHGIECRKIQPL